MTLSSAEQTAFQRQVASRFGLVPNFFVSAPDAPEIIERLWDFAKAAYLDNPIPSLSRNDCSSSLPLLRGSLLHRAPLRFPGRKRSLIR